MTLYYSATRGFLAESLHPDLPADAVAITAADHLALLDGQAAGRAIVAGDDGRPRLAPVARPTIGQLRERAVTSTKREAARRIEAIAPLWRQLNDSRKPGAQADQRFAAIDAIRAASDAIEAEIAAAANAKDLRAIDIAHHSLWPE
ncbi:MAG: hypothetical protein V4523_05025 [Pseudomonadota bacterium]